MYNISLNEQVIQAVEKETVHLITEAMGSDVVKLYFMALAPEGIIRRIQILILLCC